MGPFRTDRDGVLEVRRPLAVRRHDRPLVGEGHDVRMDADGWTARTADGSLSAHFEYSVAVTDRGPRVLGVAV